jgi:hypothetical protein
MVPLPLKTLIGEKNDKVYGHIFKMAPLPLKNLIGEKDARVLRCQQPSEHGNLCLPHQRDCTRAPCKCARATYKCA